MLNRHSLGAAVITPLRDPYDVLHLVLDLFVAVGVGLLGLVGLQLDHLGLLF